MTPNIYYSEWDQIIQNWYSNPNALNSLMDKGRSLSMDHVPEPYYGDMDNCSVVIINLNPGTGLCEQCWKDQNNTSIMVNEIKKSSYSCFAKSFPLLRGKGPEPSINWWKIRKAWIDRILKVKQVNSTKMPFAIELVPLHSKSFKIADTESYVKTMTSNHPNLDVIDAIEYAIGKSEAKMGLAIGKPIYEVLLKNGFSHVQGNGISWPLKPDPAVNRFYCVIGKDSDPAIRILCTWSYGSNSAPASSFEVHERALLKVFFK